MVVQINRENVRQGVSPAWLDHDSFVNVAISIGAGKWIAATNRIGFKRLLKRSMNCLCKRPAEIERARIELATEFC